jgi:hypothetical protein
MAKEQKSNKEGKKKPQLTLLEKRAAKRNKGSDKSFLAGDSAAKGGGATGRQK